MCTCHFVVQGRPGLRLAIQECFFQWKGNSLYLYRCPCVYRSDHACSCSCWTRISVSTLSLFKHTHAHACTHTHKLVFYAQSTSMLRNQGKTDKSTLLKNCSVLQKSQSVFISFPFHVLSENSFNTASRKMVNAHTVSLCGGNTGLTLNCLRIQYQDYTKCNTDTNTMAA